MESTSPNGRRVAHVTSVHVWSDTRIFHRMCRGLARKGWDVSLVAPAKKAEIVDSVAIVPISSPKSRILRALVGGFRAVRKARSLDVDLYHLHDPELLLWVWYLRWAGKPIIFDMHEFVAGAIQTRPWIPRFARGFVGKIWAQLERVTLYDCGVVFAEDSYARHYPWLSRSAVVLNLPDVRSLLDLEPDRVSSDRIVYVGRVSRTRGSCTMLRALRVLLDRDINIGFDCVGHASREHLQELRDLTAALGLSRVHFHGYLQPADAWRIASGATAGLAVLNAEPNYVESYPTKMFEYMALSIPVIVSDFPLYSAVVRGADCGLCVPPEDPAALADAIAMLLKDAEMVRRYGKNGRAAVISSYRWDTQLSRLEALYVAELSR